MNEVPLQYGAILGKGDASNWIDWSISLSEEEMSIYKNAIKNKISLNDVEGLKNALSRAYNEIEKQEIQNGIEYGDEYIIECVEREVSPFDEAWILKVQFVDPNEK